MVERFEGHAAREAAIADDGYGMCVTILKARTDGHAKRCTDRCT
jgi:hypothetical protein